MEILVYFSFVMTFQKNFVFYFIVCYLRLYNFKYIIVGLFENKRLYSLFMGHFEYLCTSTYYNTFGSGQHAWTEYNNLICSTTNLLIFLGFVRVSSAVSFVSVALCTWCIPDALIRLGSIWSLLETALYSGRFLRSDNII